jgi:hypothetical protein
MTRQGVSRGVHVAVLCRVLGGVDGAAQVAVPCRVRGGAHGAARAVVFDVRAVEFVSFSASVYAGAVRVFLQLEGFWGIGMLRGS